MESPVTSPGERVARCSIHKREEITLTEKIYCYATVFVAFGNSLCMVGTTQFMAELQVLFAFVLCALFPIGVFIELAHARIPIPRMVLLCLVLTAVWTSALIKWNWR